MNKNEGLTMNQLAEINAQHVTTIAALEAKCAALAADNAALKSSRETLAKNTLEACNSIAVAGFRHEAQQK